MVRPVWCWSVLTGYVAAIAFPAPRATSAAENGSPLSAPQPTGGPRTPPSELLRRDATTIDLVAPDNTCGYISGLAGAVYNCLSATEKCAFIPGTSTSPGVVACCNTQYCGARITCVDYVAYHSSSVCDNGCVKDTFTLKCTASTAPYCNGITFVDANVRDYFCDSNTVSTWQTAYSTFSGETDGRQFSKVTITPTTSKSASSAAPSTTSTTGSVGSSTTSAVSTSTSAPPSSGSSTPIGPIVGGVVGGVGGIALVCLLVFFLVRRHDKKKKNMVNNNSGAAAPGYIPPQDSNKPVTGMQEQGPNGQWVSAPIGDQYTSQHMHGPYQPVHQQQYPPVAEMQGNIYHPQQTGLAPTGYQPAHQSPGQTYSHPASPGQLSQNSGHLSSTYPGNNSIISPVSNRRSELLGSEAQGPSPAHSPSPTFATTGTGTSPAAGQTAVPHTQSTGDRAEMSANMAGGRYASNLHTGTYEVPGDVGYHG